MSSADRAHFQRIAEACEAIERDRQEVAAVDHPAAKVEEALRLSNALLRGIPEDLEPEVKRFSLIERWRALQAEGCHGDPRS